MKPCVLLVLVCGGLGSASVPVSRDTIASSLSSLMSPNLCQLKLICALSKTSNLQHSVFMRGISTLADLAAGSFLANTTADAFLLQHSLETGRAGKPCSLAAPQCPYSERELVAATEDLGITRDPGLDNEVAPRSRWRRQTRPRRQHSLQVRRRRVRGRPRPLPSHNRRQSVLGRMPPIFRPRGSEAREVCRTCDVRGNVCSVYGIGSFIGCTGVLLIGGVPAQVACNVVTTPGSIGCGMNTLHCFMESCGLVRMQLP